MQDRMRNEDLRRQKTKISDIIEHITKQKWRWTGCSQNERQTMDKKITGMETKNGQAKCRKTINSLDGRPEKNSNKLNRHAAG